MSELRRSTRRSAQWRSGESGIALIMALILTVLLFVLVAELVTTAQLSRLTGENTGLLYRMRMHQQLTMIEVEEQLKDDLAAASEGEGEGEGEGSGGLGAMGSGAQGAGAGGQGEEEGSGEEAVDSSRDPWFEPIAHAEEDITTYVWVEDENRKFNVLSLLSPDEEFAREQRECFVRLIDTLREDTEFDLPSSRGQRIADDLVAWMRGGGRGADLERAPLKSDGYERRSEYSLPIHLEEMLLLDSVDEELYYDKVWDERIVPGLESVLTVYTSLQIDPGDPDKVARRARQNNQGNGNQGNNQGNQGNSNQGNNNQGNQDPENAEQPIGQGIRLNINTMTRPLFRAVFPPEVSDSVIEAILRYRNEEDEEAEGAEGEEFGVSSELDTGESKKLKFFAAVEDLEKVPEFANVASARIKQDIYPLLTVQSDVFTIHMASMYKRNEEQRIYTLRRSRSVVVRMDEGEEPTVHPLIRLEECHGLRIKPIDLPEDYQLDMYNAQLDEMDEFSAEERRWNPFYLEFYFEYENGVAK